jgi:DNA-binding PucR family transcriptional regulator
MSSVPVHERAEHLIRSGAGLLLDIVDDIAEPIAERHLRAHGMEGVANDPVLAAASLRAIRATLHHWAACVADDPWAPVPESPDPDSLRLAGDLVRRGLGESMLTAYRVVQVDAWRAWVSYVTSTTDDVDLVREVLDHTAASIGDYCERTIQALQDVILRERENLLRGDLPERRAMIELLLDGSPVDADQVRRRLSLDVRRPHTAVIVWTVSDGPDETALREAVDIILRASAARQHVTSYPSTGVVWLWFAGAPPESRRLEHDLRHLGSVRVALGSAQVGAEGFRTSHHLALDVQRLLTRSDLHRVAGVDDTRLATLLTRDADGALEFARIVLGDLAGAPVELRRTVRVYLEEIGSLTRTAERLVTHRNTVVRRLEKADALLPRPLAINPLDVATALEVWQWLEVTATARPQTPYVPVT